MGTPHSRKLVAEKRAAVDLLLAASDARGFTTSDLCGFTTADSATVRGWRSKRSVPMLTVERIWDAVGAIKNGGLCPNFSRSGGEAGFVPPPGSSRHDADAYHLDSATDAVPGCGEEVAWSNAPPRQQELFDGPSLVAAVEALVAVLPTEVLMSEVSKRMEAAR